MTLCPSLGKKHISAAAVLEADLQAGPGETWLNTTGEVRKTPGCYQNAGPPEQHKPTLGSCPVLKETPRHCDSFAIFPGGIFPVT